MLSARNCLISLGALALLAVSARAGEPLTDAQVEEGRALFAQFNCAACHTLADAGANGGQAPSLDGNAKLNAEYIAQQLREGGDEMPAYGEVLSEQQLAQLTAYILQVRQ